MPTIQLHIKYSKNIDIIMTPRDLLDMYFYGINTKDANGNPIPDHIYKTYILSAQQEIEKYLGLKLLKQVIKEDSHYHATDWGSWGMMQTSYQVVKPVELIGFYGAQKHITVPKEWLVSKKSNDDLYHRSLWLVPNGTGWLQTTPVIGGSLAPNFTFSGREIPNYWSFTYITGFDKTPMDLYNFVGKMAAVNVFNMLGDLVLGLGVTSQSISVDGLSQSISSNKSATSHAYSARVNAYSKDLADSLPRLKDFYTGIKFTCA